jgi:hypothetical protein
VILNRVLSLTAAVDPVIRLSKSTLVEEHKRPEIVQSEESSTGRMKVGKVRKLPLLSARKLHPASLRKQWTERRGLRSLGT